MNEVIKQLYERKSCRSFQAKAIDEESKRLILNSAIQAPSAGNMTLYSIIDVTDQKLKDELAITCDNQPFIAKASMVLVFCADYARWLNVFKGNCDHVRNASYGDLMLASVDATIAAQNSVVAAQSLGIESCYIGDILENYEKHQALLKLPDHVVPICMLVFGYPNPDQVNRIKPARFEINDIVHENSYEEKDMLEMLMHRQKVEDKEKMVDWIQKFCERKYNSDFSIEMSRSCEQMIKEWTSHQ